MTSSKRASARLLLTVLVTAFATGPVAANVQDEVDDGPAREGSLAAALDVFFAEKMKTADIPGAVFVLVKDGRVLISKGYGYADLKRKTPVTPDRTIFRAGSISKLVTATAVMQLKERGRLDLARDVNDYLTLFKIPATDARPVTMADLLTHTGGFAEHVHGQHVLDARNWLPLGPYLAKRMPPRVMPPGEVISYNDHGVSLAGFVVETISGQPYAEYVSENIFRPLRMDRSTFEQPLPPAWIPELATGYALRGGALIPYSLDFCETTPAAGLYTTAADMAKFMIAHLQGGAYGDVRILEPATASDMHARHFTHHPRIRGRAYGFSESFENGRRAIFHDGGMPGFNSRLFLLPEDDMGFFVCWNNDPMGLKWALTTLLLKHFFPVPSEAAAGAPLPEVKEDLTRFCGHYRKIEGLSTTVAKLKSMNELVSVATTDGRRLRIVGEEYVPVEPLLFREKDGTHIAFRQRTDGSIALMFIGTAAFDKVRWYETPLSQRGFMGVAVVTFLSAVVWWLYLGWRRRKRGTADAMLGLERVARFVAGLTALLDLTLLVGVALYFIRVDTWRFMRGEHAALDVLLLIPFLGVPLTAVALGFATAVWIKRSWGTIERLHFTFVVLVEVVFVGFLQYWNLLGFRY